MHALRYSIAAPLLCLILATAHCASGGSTAAARCMIPPGPAPAVYLLYPPPNATNVPVTIGALYFAAQPYGYVPTNASVALTSATGVPLAGGSPQAFAGSLPQGAATPPPSSQPYSFFSVSVPTLTAATSYIVSLSITQYVNLPTECQKHFDFRFGPFVTQ